MMQQFGEDIDRTENMSSAVKQEWATRAGALEQQLCSMVRLKMKQTIVPRATVAKGSEGPV